MHAHNAVIGNSIVNDNSLAFSPCKSTPFDAEELCPSSASIFLRLGIGVLKIYSLMALDIDIKVLILMLTVPSISDQMYMRRAPVAWALQLFECQQQVQTHERTANE